MAIEDKYTETAVQNGLTGESGAVHEVVRYIGFAEIAAADDDGSKYRLIKGIPSSFRPVRAIVQTTAITGGTDYELGLYDTNSGAVVSKGLFMTGQTLASASRTLDGLANVSLADLAAKKSIAELLSLTPTTAKASYDLVLTGDTVGTAAGTVVVILDGFAA
jgi:hypothetical protein